MSDIDPETQKYYNDYFDLFNTDGWIRFVREMRDAKEQDEQTADTRCIGNDQWQYERGTKNMSRRVIGFEASIRDAYDQLNKPEEDLDLEWDNLGQL